MQPRAAQQSALHGLAWGMNTKPLGAYLIRRAPVLAENAAEEACTGASL